MRYGGIKSWVGEAALPGRAVVARAPTPPRQALAGARGAPPGPRWPPARLAAVEALWGTGFVGPGGAAEAIRLARPINLDAEMRVMLLGGGLGGPARAIHADAGAWVSSFEADPGLADAALRGSGLRDDKRLAFHGWDRDNPAFHPKSADHAMVLEALRGATLDPVIDGLAAALLPGAHVVMTELVADLPPDRGDREFAAWCRLEDRAPQLPRSEAVTDALGRGHFDVHSIEDLSDRHVTATLAGWRAAVQAMARGDKPDAAAAALFVTEAELWLLRIRLMRRFGLRLLCWHAIGAA